jgi:hypothetical protein
MASSTCLGQGPVHPSSISTSEPREGEVTPVRAGLLPRRPKQDMQPAGLPSRTQKRRVLLPLLSLNVSRRMRVRDEISDSAAVALVLGTDQKHSRARACSAAPTKMLDSRQSSSQDNPPTGTIFRTLASHVNRSKVHKLCAQRVIIVVDSRRSRCAAFLLWKAEVEPLRRLDGYVASGA